MIFHTRECPKSSAPIRESIRLSRAAGLSLDEDLLTVEWKLYERAFTLLYYIQEMQPLQDPNLVYYVNAYT